MSVELERAKSEILSLKRELAAVKLENRVLRRRPTKDEEKAFKEKAEHLARKSELDEKRKQFNPGPNIEAQKLRKRLQKAENELWSLKHVRD